MLEKAIHIAVEAHAGQVDKAGKAYILHPMRVMLSGRNEDEMICGILHDVIEDTPISIDMLRLEGFTEPVLSALDAISKRKGEDYMDFIERVACNELATIVKLNDLHDNMNRERIKEYKEADERRHAKYVRAEARLKQVCRERGWSYRSF